MLTELDDYLNIVYPKCPKACREFVTHKCYQFCDPNSIREGGSTSGTKETPEMPKLKKTSTSHVSKNSKPFHATNKTSVFGLKSDHTKGQGVPSKGVRKANKKEVKKSGASDAQLKWIA